MRRVRGFAARCSAVLSLLILASACSKDEARRIVAPSLPDPPEVTGARWVWEPRALAGAVQAAGKNPLVQRALLEAPVGRLQARHDLAVRAVGEGSDGRPVGLTILAYAVDGDPARAAFVSMAEGFGSEVAEFAELILGRDPRADETGFHRIVWGGRTVWVRSADPQFATSAHPAPLRRQWTKLFDCLAERMPSGCAAGAAIGQTIAPGLPHAAAVGCGIGAAAGGISCVADFLKDK